MKSWRVFLSFLFDVLLEGVTKRVIVRVVFSPSSRGQVWRVLYKSVKTETPLSSPPPRSVESQSLKCSQQLVWKNKI